MPHQQIAQPYQKLSAEGSYKINDLLCNWAQNIIQWIVKDIHKIVMGDN